MRISDWSSDVCSSDLWCRQRELDPGRQLHRHKMMQCREQMTAHFKDKDGDGQHQRDPEATRHVDQFGTRPSVGGDHFRLEPHAADRSEEHTSELQSLMRISYAVFCLKKKKNKQRQS